MGYIDNRYNEHPVNDKEREKQTGSVWTPPEIIDKMIEKVDENTWKDPTKTFLDPTAGSGNILVRMLEKRLASGVSKKDAISTLYGVELEQANVNDTYGHDVGDSVLLSVVNVIKERLRTVLGDGVECHDYDDIIDHNIVCHDFFTWSFEDWKPIEETNGNFEDFFE